MGVVYDAYREDGQRAALKVVNPGLANDQRFRSRFRREVEVNRRVSSPRTAAVLDADPNGKPPWLATEYVAGPNLEDAVARNGPIRGDALLSLAVALLQALDEIHQVGVVHRDLKPSNVILTAATPKVIDFGIALADDATSLTATGAFIGSPGWMSPEQVRGEHVTAASDVFSWAALVAYAATGRPPFGEGRPEAVAYRVVHTRPDLAGVPQPLMTAVQQALRSEPTERPTPQDLIAQLVYGSDPTTRVAQGWATAPETLLIPADRTTVDKLDLPVSSSPKRQRSWLWATAVGLVVVAAVAIAAVALARQDETPTTSLTGAADLATTTTSPPESSTAPSTSASSSTSTTTTAPPSTAPAEPLFDGRLGAATSEALNLLDFAESHKQETIRIDAALDDLNADDLYRLDESTHVVYVPGACEQFCEGDAYELLIKDLDSVPDAAVYYDSGAIEINGRFVVNNVQLQNGGIFSIALRAVPIA